MFSRKISKTRQKLDRGLAHMENGLYKAAIKNFEAAVRKKDGSNLERNAAAWWMVNAAKYRKEWKKKKYGNANLFWYYEDHNRQAWSDVEIAAVLLTPDTRKLNDYLAKFLGRTLEAVRFQRRYAYGRPLVSWKKESGKRYTRYTQTNYVKNKLGV